AVTHYTRDRVRRDVGHIERNPVARPAVQRGRSTPAPWACGRGAYDPLVHDAPAEPHPPHLIFRVHHAARELLGRGFVFWRDRTRRGRSFQTPSERRRVLQPSLRTRRWCR